MTEKNKIDKIHDKLILQAKKLALVELQIKIKEQIEKLEDEINLVDLMKRTYHFNRRSLIRKLSDQNYKDRDNLVVLACLDTQPALYRTLKLHWLGYRCNNMIPGPPSLCRCAWCDGPGISE